MEITPDIFMDNGSDRSFRSQRFRHSWNPGGFNEVIWNPLAGCVPDVFSEACLKCYALARVKSNMGRDSYIRKQTIWKPIYNSEQMSAPLKWGTGHRLVWVANNSDFFLEIGVMRPFLDRIWSVMMALPQHTFVIMTKRPQNILPYLDGRKIHNDNIWVGISCENQQTADTRIPLLLDTPFKTKVVRYEPALGAVDFKSYISEISWIIAGGQSGRVATPTNPYWIRAVRDLCDLHGKPFWFEDWGRYSPWDVVSPHVRRNVRDSGVITYWGQWLRGAEPREWGEEKMVRRYATPLLDGTYWFQWPGTGERSHIVFVKREGKRAPIKQSPQKRYTRKLWDKILRHAPSEEKNVKLPRRARSNLLKKYPTKKED